jgi:hypothetical protein
MAPAVILGLTGCILKRIAELHAKPLGVHHCVAPSLNPAQMHKYTRVF